MKAITESAEVFQAYAMIDYCHFALGQMHEQLNKPKSPIERMVDDALHMDDHYFTGAAALLEELISCKKIIDADYSKDQEMLDRLKALNQPH